MKNASKKSIGQIQNIHALVLNQDQMNLLKGGNDGDKDGLGIVDLIDG
jgi:hypothetical protein